MSFWLREIAGWLLLGLSLVMISLLYVFCERRMILEIWPWMIMTIFVFRGAIHLLKVAIAARVAQQIQNRFYPGLDPAPLEKPLNRLRSGLNRLEDPKLR